MALSFAAGAADSLRKATDSGNGSTGGADGAEGDATVGESGGGGNGCDDSCVSGVSVGVVGSTSEHAGRKSAGARCMSEVHHKPRRSRPAKQQSTQLMQDAERTARAFSKSRTRPSPCRPKPAGPSTPKPATTRPALAQRRLLMHAPHHPQARRNARGGVSMEPVPQQSAAPLHAAFFLAPFLVHMLHTGPHAHSVGRAQGLPLLSLMVWPGLNATPHGMHLDVPSVPPQPSASP
jgi:hypothetical protein